MKKNTFLLLLFNLFLTFGTFCANAQDYNESDEDDWWSDIEDWAEDHDIDVYVYDNWDDYVYAHNNDNDPFNDIEDWNGDGCIDAYDASIHNWFASNEPVVIIVEGSEEYDPTEDSGDVCDPGSNAYNPCACLELDGIHLCECDPAYCDAVNDPCALVLAEVDECECYGVNCDDNVDPCDLYGGNYNLIKCMIKQALEEESDVPCPGDPLKNPEIAPQTNSGINGGKYGKTRSDGKQGHWGLDLKSEFGDPIYAMYDGHASSVSKFYTKAGWIVYQTAIIDGESFSIQYFHMQKDNRFTGDVEAGDIIGYQGKSGNLGRAIDQGLSESHLHIKMKDSNGNTVNPEDYLQTTFDSEGNPTNNCD